MKEKKFREEVRNLSAKELNDKLDSLKRELFGLRLNASNAHIKDYSQFKKLKRGIACVATVLRQADLSNQAK